MTKTLAALLILSTYALSACASTEVDEKFAAEDCKSINALFRDQNMNISADVANFDNDYQTEASKDKVTLPWVKGGTNADKISKERAAMRKAHSRKGCAE